MVTHMYEERESVGEEGTARRGMYEDQSVGLGQHPEGVFTDKERGISGGILEQSIGARN